MLSVPAPGWSRQHGDSASRAGTVPCGVAARAPTSNTKTRPSRFVLVAGGDVMLGRYIKATYRRSGGDKPFEHLARRFKRADLGFINLETPLMDSVPEPIAKGRLRTRNLTFRADEAVAQQLKEAGIGAVALANNHAEDGGHTGVAATIRALDRAGVQHAGTSADGDAYAGRSFQVGDTRVILLAITLHRNHGPFRKGERPSVAYMRRKTAMERVPKAVAKARADTPEALILLSIHWGEEYRTRPYHGQRMLARAAIDAGVDVVLGHHPHVLQPVEAYGDGLILYSMGNLIFDMKRADTRQSALFRIVFERDATGRLRAHTLRIEPARLRGVRNSTTMLDERAARTFLRDFKRMTFNYSRTRLCQQGGELVWQRGDR